MHRWMHKSKQKFIGAIKPHINYAYEKIACTYACLCVCMYVAIRRPHTVRVYMYVCIYTVELPNNGHIGSGPFVLYIEVVPL